MKRVKLSEKRQRLIEEKGPRGIVCPRCGCRHLYVVYTYPIKGGARRRRRQCRNCGRRITTDETPLSGS